MDFLLGVCCLIVSSICDNLRGPLLPLLSRQYELNYGQAALFLTTGSAASFGFNLLSARMLARINERQYLFLAVGLQSAALVALAFGSGYAVFLTAAALWGAGQGGMGLASNLFVIRGTTEAARVRAMNGLHVFYGLSSSIPAWLLAQPAAGRFGISSIVLFPLPFLLALAIVNTAAAGAPMHAEASLPPRDTSRDWTGWRGLSIVAIISTYVLGEVLTSMWLPSFLSGERGLPLDEASRWLSFFFLGLGLGRLLTAVWLPKRLEAAWPLAALPAAFAALLLGRAGWLWAFPLTGFLMGPVFPMMMSRAPLEFPAGYRGLISIIYAVMTVALGLGHMAMGKTADAFSLKTAFLMPVFFTGAAWVLIVLRRLSVEKSS